METEFRVRVHHQGRAAVLVLIGELDLASHRSLEQAIDLALELDPQLVVLDLEQLEFMDVAGLRSVLRSDERLRAAGKRLVLAAPPPVVRRLLTLTRQEQAIEARGSVAEVLEPDLR